MSETAIRVENLGKKYIISHKQGLSSNKSLRESISNTVKSIGQKFLPSSTKEINPSREEFWALQDISFEIKQGDRVGVIGRNGAGKSTLLKILSRVTEPTHGKIAIRGRVASLLEVGTGFHQELSGRENIYLNGAILGMGKEEIKRKFDEIIAFAEVEKFLDTPVKRYSSGMYVRLAFAVAAHLDPEVLIVDEVLAVGDAQFQKKCLGKMEDVSTKEGRTVIFVSHQMSAIEALCSRAILLQSGKVVLDSNPQEAIRGYLGNAYSLTKGISLKERTDRTGNGKVRFESFRIIDEEGTEVTALQSGKDYRFELGYFNSLEKRTDNVVVSLDIFDERNNRVMLFRTNFTNDNLSLNPGFGSISCSINKLPLANGEYRFLLFMSYADTEIFDWIEDAASARVDGGDFFGTGSIGLPTHCKLLSEVQWSNS
ncbi:ABC transporter ATP-binding protein [Tumidithrix elongata RA019]|uniref:ABC transporter ATP-binding protein n=1 Tax=Tumidithrix elongata BACA0141 TaxID=2716417 RepID=A0AAW9PRS0_9CYAN|nr:ABC transporter ATP-binding protein [Tumidithrix elongata RA019]